MTDDPRALAEEVLRLSVRAAVRRRAAEEVVNAARAAVTATRVMELHRTQHAPGCPCATQLRIESSACTCGLWEADVALASLRAALARYDEEAGK